MTEIVVAQRMWQRRGTTAEWAAANPVLAQGEIGVETFAAGMPVKIKIGDGVTAWALLRTRAAQAASRRPCASPPRLD